MLIVMTVARGILTIPLYVVSVLCILAAQASAQEASLLAHWKLAGDARLLGQRAAPSGPRCRLEHGGAKRRRASGVRQTMSWPTRGQVVGPHSLEIYGHHCDDDDSETETTISIGLTEN